MGGAFKKDEVGTFIVEMIPLGGLITAPIHAAAGNYGHAVAAVAGAVIDVAIPGGGGAAAKAAVKGAVKHDIKRGANAIKKRQK